MALSVGVQMDHVRGIDRMGDSTFALLLEAQRRGHTIRHWTVNALAMRDGRVLARTEALQVRDEAEHFALADEQEIELGSLDVVLMRQDPPFDMNYITATHLLERVHDPRGFARGQGTLVVNDPGEVRNAPEKIFVMDFPQFMPETLITRDRAEARRFRDAHGDVIVKPLYGNGGAGVFRLGRGDQNLSSLLELFESAFPEPYIVQRYLPDVRAGDKRIILIDGVAVGAINRVPGEDEARSNMHVGGRAEHIEMTAREHEICEAIGPELKRRGFVFVGIDVIGGLMTEINVTSPTGIREVQRFSGTDIAALFWDAVEGRRDG